MCWVIEYDCGKSIYMNNVVLLYFWGGDNVWKWLLLTKDTKQLLLISIKQLCWKVINLGLQ